MKSALARCLLPFCLIMMLAGTNSRAAETAFTLRVENGRVPEGMRIVRVKLGDVVTLRWSVDRSMTLHLHGYDIEKRVEPGVTGEMTFKARATGRFPVHAHAEGASARNLAHEDAPLVYVEVYPG